MRNSHRCPKCQSSDIIRIPGRVGPYGAGSNICFSWFWQLGIEVTRYLCGGCGFIEEWVDSDQGIAEVRKKYGDREATT